MNELNLLASYNLKSSFTALDIVDFSICLATVTLLSPDLHFPILTSSHSYMVVVLLPSISLCFLTYFVVHVTDCSWSILFSSVLLLPSPC